MPNFILTYRTPHGSAALADPAGLTMWGTFLNAVIAPNVVDPGWPVFEPSTVVGEAGPSTQLGAATRSSPRMTWRQRWRSQRSAPRWPLAAVSKLACSPRCRRSTRPSRSAPDCPAGSARKSKARTSHARLPGGDARASIAVGMVTSWR
jgi:hypothetical protein